jgi:hypothetical protein
MLRWHHWVTSPARLSCSLYPFVCQQLIHTIITAPFVRRLAGADYEPYFEQSDLVHHSLCNFLHSRLHYEFKAMIFWADNFFSFIMFIEMLSDWSRVIISNSRIKRACLKECSMFADMFSRIEWLIFWCSSLYHTCSIWGGWVVDTRRDIVFSPSRNHQSREVAAIISTGDCCYHFNRFCQIGIKRVSKLIEALSPLLPLRRQGTLGEADSAKWREAIEQVVEWDHRGREQFRRSAMHEIMIVCRCTLYFLWLLDRVWCISCFVEVMSSMNRSNFRDKLIRWSSWSYIKFY